MIGTILRIALAVLPAFAQPEPTLEQAIDAIREKVKPAYLAPKDIREAVPAAELARLNDPALKTKDDPGTRRSKVERFLEALEGIERMQNAKAEAPLPPKEKMRLVVLIKEQLKLETKEHSEAIGVYRPCQALVGPLEELRSKAQAPPPEPPQPDRRVDLGSANAAIGRIGRTDPFGRPGNPGALEPTGGPMGTSPAPSAPSGRRSQFETSLATARQIRAAADQAVLQDFQRVYRQDGAGAISIGDAVRFYEEAGTSDIRPGEGALGYTARRTGSIIAQHALEGVSAVQESVLRNAYTSGSSEMSDEGRRSVAAGALLSVGSFATDAVPGGRQAKVIATNGVKIIEKKLAAKAAESSLDFTAAAAPRPHAPGAAPLKELDFTAAAAPAAAPAQDVARALSDQERRAARSKYDRLQSSPEFGKVQMEYKRVYLGEADRLLKAQGLRAQDVYVHGTGAAGMRGIVDKKGMGSFSNDHRQNGVWAVDGTQFSDTFGYAWKSGPAKGEQAVMVVIRKDTGLVTEGQIFNRNPTIDDIHGFIVTDGKTSTFLTPQQLLQP